MSNSDSVAIGAESDGGQKLQGQMDDVRIYNRELTAEEIKKLYNMTQSDIDPITQRVQWKLGDGKKTNISNLISLHKLNQSITDSKGDHDGFVVGEEQYTDGVYDSKSFDFDGSTKIILENKSDYNFSSTSPFSIAFWFKPNLSQTACIVAKQQTSGLAGYSVIFEVTKILFRLDSGPNFDVRSSTGGLDLNTWYHVVCTKSDVADESGMSIYIDGVKDDDAGTGAIGTMTNDESIHFGRFGNDSSPFTGQLDEVRIFDKELTAEEIKRLYESTDSAIDDYRDDNIPTRSLEINFEHKSHFESLKKVAKALGKDLFFDSLGHRVFIQQKGKKIKEIFDKMTINKPKFNLNNVANIVNVVGSEKEEGGQREETFTDSNTLKYDYETTIANKQIATNETLNLVGNEVLTSLKDLTPDLTIDTTPEQFNRFDLGVGDTLNISELEQDLQGKFRIIKISTTETKVKLSLSSETNQTIQTSGKDIGSIIGNIINAVQDLNITPE
jgi:hypothetical protein